MPKLCHSPGAGRSLAEGQREGLVRNEEVAGSIPVGSTILFYLFVVVRIRLSSFGQKPTSTYRASSGAFLCDGHVTGLRRKSSLGGLVKKPNIANPNLTRATEAGKEGGGETKTLRTGTRYEAWSERRVGEKRQSPQGKPTA